MTLHTPIPSLLRMLALAAGAVLVAHAPYALAEPRTAVERHNGISYVNGGIGDRDQQRTKALGESMNLQAIFARSDGAYLSGIDVTLRDASGRTLLDLDSARPLLYAEVPPGRYQLIASFEGSELRRDLRVPQRGRHVELLRWNTGGLQGDN